MTLNLLLAQTESNATSLIPFVLLMAGFVVFMNITQRRRGRRQQDFQKGIETGDRVQTIGGIQGKVIAADDDTITLEVESGKIRFARRAIAAKLPD